MCRISEEDLGWFLVVTLYRRFTSMVTPCCSLLGGGVGLLGRRAGGRDNHQNHLYHNYDHMHRINVTTPYFESQQREVTTAGAGVRNKVNGVTATATAAREKFKSPILRQTGGGEEGLVESSIEDEATSISSNFFSAGESMTEIMRLLRLPRFSSALGVNNLQRSS